MITLVNRNELDSYAPRYAGQELIIGIDSSKTNSALTIGDANGNELEIIEFNGVEDKDVLMLCYKQREILKSILHGAKIRAVGIEDIITKKETDEKGAHINNGMQIHHSRFKITAVFMSFISFFQDNFKHTPILVNNWDWKVAILPEHFRKREFKKGSQDYFKEINHRFKDYSDDATDSCCIYQYLCKLLNVEKGVKISGVEAPIGKMVYAIWSTRVKDTILYSKMFIHNADISLEQNATAMCNALKIGEVGISILKYDNVSYEDLFNLVSGDFQQVEPSVMLAVRRES